MSWYSWSFSLLIWSFESRFAEHSFVGVLFWQFRRDCRSKHIVVSDFSCCCGDLWGAELEAHSPVLQLGLRVEVCRILCLDYVILVFRYFCFPFYSVVILL
ncbi:hypothetical protein GIB67_021746 [Kingdonia uniflora]|uniref:Secreted protein n=1 Tax=Kingdonia uniflora TaxID=39325 RepID=A0A7J7M9V8_9MAGN|nr:hypothetical protein GIB67_021746 [Kingdonia uniflora]